MPNCEISINEIIKNIEIDRPSFKFLKEAYEKITNIKSDKSLQKTLYEAIYDQIMIYTRNDECESEKNPKNFVMP
ncbi:hypothetical protein LS70_009250 [Helicobacter sp. MIT 11-5569]|uniref:hypothetical protein n=1 Tax=Helicobacter sp. MIT 11-5569 TaxID=1548151 RepID=UPI00051FBFB8|nr:hypothetical protein [Helicobacter sp. MIT 11-5569]TLD80356.1 hypothetical protein LS70_009250 [Helicobacter sp. MIT 11-5569]